MLLCVTTGTDKILFGKVTKLLVEAGEYKVKLCCTYYKHINSVINGLRIISEHNYRILAPWTVKYVKKKSSNITYYVNHFTFPATKCLIKYMLNTLTKTKLSY